MDDQQLGAAVRALRHRRNWRQNDLAASVGVSPGVVGLVERGHAESVALRKVRALCAALEMRVRWDVGWHGADLFRLRDADHAALANDWKLRLERGGYLVRAEISFNRYGERGRIDLLAFHPVRRNLLVIEIKTVLADTQGLLGSLDVKRRLAGHVGAELGWRADHVVPMIVLSATTTNRRRLDEHAALFSGYSLRGRSALAWLRQPAGAPDGVLILATLPDRKSLDGRSAGRQRVRPGRRPSGTNGSRQTSE